MTIDNGVKEDQESVKPGSWFLWEARGGKAFPVLYYSVVPTLASAASGVSLTRRLTEPRKLLQADYDECCISVRVSKELGKPITPVDFFARKYPLPPIVEAEMTDGTGQLTQSASTGSNLEPTSS